MSKIYMKMNDYSKFLSFDTDKKEINPISGEYVETRLFLVEEEGIIGDDTIESGDIIILFDFYERDNGKDSYIIVKKNDKLYDILSNVINSRRESHGCNCRCECEPRSNAD